MNRISSQTLLAISDALQMCLDVSGMSIFHHFFLHCEDYINQNCFAFVRHGCDVFVFALLQVDVTGPC